MTHVKRTKVLVLEVLGADKSIEIAVSEATWIGINSEDWQVRARKFAGLAKQVREKLRATRSWDPGFLSEKDITVVEVRPIRGAPPIEDPPF